MNLEIGVENGPIAPTDYDKNTLASVTIDLPRKVNLLEVVTTHDGCPAASYILTIPLICLT